ncbi:MAG: hypothetical protein JRI61_06380 [Deltaproteobacteria bacterium]|nr:hypothetical protein [Deltaproteobacteria bacterium]
MFRMKAGCPIAENPLPFGIGSLVKSQNPDGKEKSSSSRRANLEEYRASDS